MFNSSLVPKGSTDAASAVSRTLWVSVGTCETSSFGEVLLVRLEGNLSCGQKRAQIGVRLSVSLSLPLSLSV